MLWYSAEDGWFPGQAGTYQTGESGTYVRDSFDAHGVTDEQRIAGVAAQALEELQDFIDEATHQPWPGIRTPPRAYAQVRGGVLHLWYGHRQDSRRLVLSCEPIPLATLLALPAP